MQSCDCCNRSQNAGYSRPRNLPRRMVPALGSDGEELQAEPQDCPRFDKLFWCRARQLRIACWQRSNAFANVKRRSGAFTRIAPAHRRKNRGNFLPRFFSVGHRTGRAARPLHPMSITGSVWPQYNALTRFLPLRSQDSVSQFSGPVSSASYRNSAVSGLFCDFQRRWIGSTLYPLCAPQAWAPASIFNPLEASLGLELDRGMGGAIANPHLPFFDRFTLRNLHLGRPVDIRVLGRQMLGGGYWRTG